MTITRRTFYDPRIMRSYALPALIIVMGLQLLRVFFPSLAWYLMDTVGVPSLSLSVYAFGAFAVGFLAAALWQALGVRRSLWFVIGGLAVARLLEQISTSPRLDLWLSLAGSALFVLFLPIWLGHVRAQHGLEAGPRWAAGLLLGLATDTAIKGAAGTLDLSWIPGLVPTIAVGLMVTASLWLLTRETYPTGAPGSDSTWAHGLPLVAIGPYLLVQALVLQNQGWVAAVAGVPPPMAFLAVMLGNLLAATGLSWGLSRPHTYRPILAVVVAVYFGVAFLTADQPGIGFLTTLFVSQLLMGWGWALISTITAQATRRGLVATTISLTLGMVLFLLLAFVYYISLDLRLPLPRASIVPLSGALFGLGVLFASLKAAATGRTPWTDRTMILAASSLLVFPLAYWGLRGPTPEPGPRSPGPVAVMTYNIHSAYNEAGRQDPEAIARVIEASQAEVIGIQEISRGWLINGSTDLVAWLSHRLDMQVVFQGTTGPMWGNAILSRPAMLETGSAPLPRAAALIARGYLWADLDMGDQGALLVINTHLHQVADDHHVRLEQVPLLIDFWDQRPQSVILGDLNARPGDPEMELLAQAGLVDAWQQAGEGPGYTNPADKPDQRIDWIWISPELRVAEVSVPASTASDHRPVTAALDLSP